MSWKCNYCETVHEDPKPRCDLVPEIDIFAPDLPTNLEMMVSECKAYETTTGVGTVPLLDYNGMDLVAVEATEDDLKKLNVTHTVYFADDGLLIRHENRWIGLIRLADPHAEYKVWEPGGAHPLFDFVRAVEKDKEEMKGMGILTEEAFELFKEYRKSATILAIREKILYLYDVADRLEGKAQEPAS